MTLVDEAVHYIEVAKDRITRAHFPTDGRMKYLDQERRLTLDLSGPLCLGYALIMDNPISNEAREVAVKAIEAAFGLEWHKTPTWNDAHSKQEAVEGLERAIQILVP